MLISSKQILQMYGQTYRLTVFRVDKRYFLSGANGTSTVLLILVGIRVDTHKEKIMKKGEHLEVESTSC